MAGREVKAARVKAQGKADSLKIIAEAQANAQAMVMEADGTQTGVTEIQSGDVRQWVHFQEKKRLSNIRSVIHQTAEYLGDKEARNEEPDPDWTAYVSAHTFNQLINRVKAVLNELGSHVGKPRIPEAFRFLKPLFRPSGTLNAFPKSHSFV